MRIESVTGDFDGRDSQRHAEMRIVVKPAGFPAKVFCHVDARDVHIWEDSKYDLEHVPYDIRERFDAWRKTIERKRVERVHKTDRQTNLVRLAALKK
jgi:hypothetical protein